MEQPESRGKRRKRKPVKPAAELAAEELSSRTAGAPAGSFAGVGW